MSHSGTQISGLHHSSLPTVSAHLRKGLSSKKPQIGDCDWRGTCTNDQRASRASGKPHDFKIGKKTIATWLKISSRWGMLCDKLQCGCWHRKGIVGSALERACSGLTLDAAPVQGIYQVERNQPERTINADLPVRTRSISPAWRGPWSG